MQALYQPSGRAAEYAPWAVNLYTGCAHRCRYCYVADMAVRFGKAKTAAEWSEREPTPREGVLEALEKDVARQNGKSGPTGAAALLCFTCDPYQPIEREHGLTRRAIEILGEGGFVPRVLTKAAALPMRDLDLLERYAGELGVTLTGLDDRIRDTYEPGADHPRLRLHLLRKARDHGIRTWVSFEPVIAPAATMQALNLALPHADVVRVGMINHDAERARAITWPLFLRQVLERLKNETCAYQIKNDLWAHADASIRGTWPQSRGRVD